MKAERHLGCSEEPELDDLIRGASGGFIFYFFLNLSQSQSTLSQVDMLDFMKKEPGVYIDITLRPPLEQGLLSGLRVFIHT